MKRFAPKNILIGLIRLYQKLRPAGTRGCCKYIPTCSQYGLEAVERFGALKGRPARAVAHPALQPVFKGRL